MKREIIQLDLNDIKLNEHNPRTINKRQLDRLVKSVQEFPAKPFQQKGELV